jgi:hypothetical protein
MSPDIHWHIGEDAEQETIAAATSPRRSRRSWIAILIVVMMGAGLGAMYHSMPEPAPRPTSTPSPTPRPTPTLPAMPFKLYAAIDREAQALADGDVMSYSVLQMPRDGQMVDQLRDDLKAWGRPIDDRPLFTIVDTNLSTANKAWADIRQFRHGRWFRTTRFYQFNSQEGRWLRTDADSAFWSGQAATLDTSHFHAIYFVEDRDFIQPVLDQLEKAQSSICADLGCGAASPTYTLKLNSAVTYGWPLSDDGREIRFPSPRVTGIYENASPIGKEGTNLIWSMAWTMAQRAAYGQPLTLNEDRDSDALLWAVAIWATRRAVDSSDTLFEWITVDQQALLPLSDLWGNITSENGVQKASQVSAVIDFIEQKNGASAISKILKSIRAAKSFPDVIEPGLGIPFAEFDQKWQARAKANLTQP